MPVNLPPQPGAESRSAKLAVLMAMVIWTWTVPVDVLRSLPLPNPALLGLAPALQRVEVLLRMPKTF